MWCTLSSPGGTHAPGPRRSAFRGGLLVTSGPEVLEEDLGLGGERWLTQEQQDWAAQWPLAMMVDPSQDPDDLSRFAAMGMQPSPVFLGMRTHAGGHELGWVSSGGAGNAGPDPELLKAYVRQRMAGMKDQLPALGLELPSAPAPVEEPEPAEWAPDN